MAQNIPQFMKAWQYSKYGGGEKALEKVDNKPVPTLGKIQILVKVHAASVNPADWKIQSGMLRPILPFKFPCIPGTDISGEIIALGRGVDSGKFAVGDQVFGLTDFRYGGSLAEYAVLSSSLAVKLPPEVSPAEAACLPVAGLSALQALRDQGGLQMDGSYRGNVLITAASGGVGTYAVQLAKLAGAHVTASCSAPKAALVTSLGADEMLDYRTPEGAALKSPSGKKYDVILDGSPALPWSTIQAALAPRGRYISLVGGLSAVPQAFLHSLPFYSDKRIYVFVMKADAGDLAFLASLLQAKKLRSVIDSSYPLEAAQAAWAKSLEGHPSGKLVVTMPSYHKETGTEQRAPAQ